MSEFRRYFAEQIQKDAKLEATILDIAELISPAAEYEIYREVRSALKREGEVLEWFQAALRHCYPMLREKRQRPRKIYKRDPHAEAMLLWRLAKMKEGPLEETVRLLRQRLYQEAEEMLKARQFRRAGAEAHQIFG